MGEPDIEAARNAILAPLEFETRPLFEKDLSRHRYQSLLKSLTFDLRRRGRSLFATTRAKRVPNEKGMERLIKEARLGCPDAEVALREVIAGIIEEGGPIPEILRTSAVELVKGGTVSSKTGRRRPKQKTHRDRDEWITNAVITLVKEHGFKCQRNTATADLTPDRHSACSFVAEVATELGVEGMSEKNVERIFSEQGGPTRLED